MLFAAGAHDRPDKDRFHRPYKHTITVPGTADPVTVSIRQQKFGPEGFASMVRWSIDAFAVVNVAYTVMFGWWIRDDHKVVASTMHEAVCSAVSCRLSVLSTQHSGIQRVIHS